MLPFPALLRTRIEQLINDLLKRDPATPVRLAELAGKSLAIRVPPAATSLIIVASATGLRLKTPHEGTTATADVVLPPAALGAWLAGAEVETLLLKGEIETRGELATLAQFRRLLTQLDLGTEATLSRWIGRLPAHGLKKWLERQRQHAHTTLDRLHTHGREYATEELHSVIDRDHHHLLTDQLTDMVRQLERSEMRVTCLEHREKRV